uniref:Uncharacterized protein n=1 Tax=Ditylenchus dipsaci TaxID=166011 RepID=A0A915ESQ3_9BILA
MLGYPLCRWKRTQVVAQDSVYMLGGRRHNIDAIYDDCMVTEIWRLDLGTQRWHKTLLKLDTPVVILLCSC